MVLARFFQKKQAEAVASNGLGGVAALDDAAADPRSLSQQASAESPNVQDAVVVPLEPQQPVNDDASAVSGDSDDDNDSFLANQDDDRTVETTTSGAIREMVKNDFLAGMSPPPANKSEANDDDNENSDDHVSNHDNAVKDSKGTTDASDTQKQRGWGGWLTKQQEPRPPEEQVNGEKVSLPSDDNGSTKESTAVEVPPPLTGDKKINNDNKTSSSSSSSDTSKQVVDGAMDGNSSTALRLGWGWGAKQQQVVEPVVVVDQGVGPAVQVSDRSDAGSNVDAPRSETESSHKGTKDGVEERRSPTEPQALKTESLQGDDGKTTTGPMRLGWGWRAKQTADAAESVKKETEPNFFKVETSKSDAASEFSESERPVESSVPFIAPRDDAKPKEESVSKPAVLKAEPIQLNHDDGNNALGGPVRLGWGWRAKDAVEQHAATTSAAANESEQRHPEEASDSDADSATSDSEPCIEAQDFASQDRGTEPKLVPILVPEVEQGNCVQQDDDGKVASSLLRVGGGSRAEFAFELPTAASQDGSKLGKNPEIGASDSEVSDQNEMPCSEKAVSSKKVVVEMSESEQLSVDSSNNESSEASDSGEESGQDDTGPASPFGGSKRRLGGDGSKTKRPPEVNDQDAAFHVNKIKDDYTSERADEDMKPFQEGEDDGKGGITLRLGWGWRTNKTAQPTAVIAANDVPKSELNASEEASYDGVGLEASGQNESQQHEKKMNQSNSTAIEEPMSVQSAFDQYESEYSESSEMSVHGDTGLAPLAGSNPRTYFVVSTDQETPTCKSSTEKCDQYFTVGEQGEKDAGVERPLGLWSLLGCNEITEKIAEVASHSDTNRKADKHPSDVANASVDELSSDDIFSAEWGSDPPRSNLPQNDSSKIESNGSFSHQETEATSCSKGLENAEEAHKHEESERRRNLLPRHDVKRDDVSESDMEAGEFSEGSNDSSSKQATASFNEMDKLVRNELQRDNEKSRSKEPASTSPDDNSHGTASPCDIVGIRSEYIPTGLLSVTPASTTCHSKSCEDAVQTERGKWSPELSHDVALTVTLPDGNDGEGKNDQLANSGGAISEIVEPNHNGRFEVGGDSLAVHARHKDNALGATRDNIKQSGSVDVTVSKVSPISPEVDRRNSETVAMNGGLFALSDCGLENNKPQNGDVASLDTSVETEKTSLEVQNNYSEKNAKSLNTNDATVVGASCPTDPVASSASDSSARHFRKNESAVLATRLSSFYSYKGSGLEEQQYKDGSELRNNNLLQHLTEPLQQDDAASITQAPMQRLAQNLAGNESNDHNLQLKAKTDYLVETAASDAVAEAFQNSFDLVEKQPVAIPHNEQKVTPSSVEDDSQKSKKKLQPKLGLGLLTKLAVAEKREQSGTETVAQIGMNEIGEIVCDDSKIGSDLIRLSETREEAVENESVEKPVTQDTPLRPLDLAFSSEKIAEASGATDASNGEREESESEEDPESGSEDQSEADDDDGNTKPFKLVVKEAPILRLENVTAATRSHIPEKSPPTKKRAAWRWFGTNTKTMDKHTSAQDNNGAQSKALLSQCDTDPLTSVEVKTQVPQVSDPIDKEDKKEDKTRKPKTDDDSAAIVEGVFLMAKATDATCTDNTKASDSKKEYISSITGGGQGDISESAQVANKESCFEISQELSSTLPVPTPATVPVGQQRSGYTEAKDVVGKSEKNFDFAPVSGDTVARDRDTISMSTHASPTQAKGEASLPANFSTLPSPTEQLSPSKKKKKKKKKNDIATLFEMNARKVSRHGDEVSVGTTNFKGGQSSRIVVLGGTNALFDEHELGPRSRPWESAIRKRPKKSSTLQNISPLDVLGSFVEEEEADLRKIESFGLTEEFFKESTADSKGQLPVLAETDEFEDEDDGEEDDGLGELLEMTDLEQKLATDDTPEANFDDMWDTVSCDVTTAMEFERAKRKKNHEKEKKRQKREQEKVEKANAARRLRLFERRRENNDQTNTKKSGKQSKLSDEFIDAIHKVFDEGSVNSLESQSDQNESDSDTQDDRSGNGSCNSLYLNGEDDSDSGDYRSKKVDDDKMNRSGDEDIGDGTVSSKSKSSKNLKSNCRGDNASKAHSRSSKRSKYSLTSSKKKRSKRADIDASEIFMAEVERLKKPKILTIQSLRQEMIDRRGTSVNLLKKEYVNFRKKRQKSQDDDELHEIDFCALGDQRGLAVQRASLRDEAKDVFAGEIDEPVEIVNPRSDGLGAKLSRWATTEGVTELDDLATVFESPTPAVNLLGAASAAARNAAAHLPELPNVPDLNNLAKDAGKGINTVGTNVYGAGQALGGNVTKVSGRVIHTIGSAAGTGVNQGINTLGSGVSKGVHTVGHGLSSVGHKLLPTGLPTLAEVPELSEEDMNMFTADFSDIPLNSIQETSDDEDFGLLAGHTKDDDDSDEDDNFSFQSSHSKRSGGGGGNRFKLGKIKAPSLGLKIKNLVPKLPSMPKRDGRGKSGNGFMMNDDYD